MGSKLSTALHQITLYITKSYKGSPLYYSGLLQLRDLVKILVTDCWFKLTLVCVAISRMFVSLHLLGGGGPKSTLFSLFLNKKASFKGISMLNGVHI